MRYYLTCMSENMDMYPRWQKICFLLFPTMYIFFDLLVILDMIHDISVFVSSDYSIQDLPRAQDRRHIINHTALTKVNEQKYAWSLTAIFFFLDFVYQGTIANEL